MRALRVGGLDWRRSRGNAGLWLTLRPPVFNTYNDQRPIHTWQGPRRRPSSFLDEEGRRGHAVDSMVCSGVVISGGTVRRSILSPRAHMHSYSLVEDSIVMHGAQIARRAAP